VNTIFVKIGSVTVLFLLNLQRYL